MAASHLPFLITNGHWISYGAALAVIILSVWNLGRRRHRLAQIQMEVLTRLGPTTPAADLCSDKLVVLEGSLKFPASDTPDLVGTLIDPLSERPVPSLEHADTGENLTLQGEQNWRLSGSVAILWAQELALRKNQLDMRIHPGERVRVQGTLRTDTETVGPDATYRDAGMRWKLVGSDKRPLQLVSCQRPRLGTGVRGIIRSAIVGLTLLTIAGYAIGACALSWTKVEEFGDVQGVLEVPLSYQLAAASPFHHSDALRAFKSRLESQRNLGSTGTYALVQLALFQGDCPEAARVAWHRNQWDLAKSLLADCPASAETSVLAFHIYRDRGSFAEASASVENAQVRSLRDAAEHPYTVGGDELPWTSVVQTHLLAGNYPAAADSFRLQASLVQQWIPSLQPGAETSREDLTSLAQSLHCLAAAAQTRADELVTDAIPLGVETDVCSLFELDQLPPSERTIMRSPSLLAAEELLKAEGNIRPEYRFALLVRPESIVELDYAFGPPWFPTNLGLLVSAHRGLVKTADSSLQRAQLSLELARLSGASGKLEQALQWAKQAEADLLQHAPAVQKQLIELVASGATTQQIEEVRDTLENGHHRFNSVQSLGDAELILAALATRRGEKEAALRHIDRADGLMYRGLPFIVKSRILGESSGLSDVDGVPRDANIVRAHSRLRPNSFADIVTLRSRIEILDAPEWKAELDQSIDRWWTALLDRDRSLLLTMLNEL